MKHTYMTKGTCSRRIDFELDGNVVKNVVFYGGFSGHPITIPPPFGGKNGGENGGK